MNKNVSAAQLLSAKSGKSNALSRRDRVVRSIVDKMVTVGGNRPGQPTRGAIPSAHELAPIVRDTMQSINDAENTLAVLPDIKYAAEVQIATILSSKDLITTSLVYECNSLDIDIEMKSKMLEYVRDYFTDDFKLNDKLYDIVYDVMYRTGSYPLCIIPESSVDRMIHGKRVGTESFNSIIGDLRAPLGLLGSTESPDSVGIETYGTCKPTTYNDLRIDFNFGGEIGKKSIQITDNPDILKFPSIEQAKSKAAVESIYDRTLSAFDNESFNDDKSTIIGAESLRANIRHNAKDGINDMGGDISSAPIVEVITPEQAGRPSTGHPLFLNLPSESVIPIHLPGDPRKQVAFIVIIDGKGNPISRHDLVNSNLAWSWINGSADSAVKDSVALGLGLKDNDITVDMTVSKLTNSFSDIIEAKVKNAINNGTYNGSVEIGRPEDVLRITLARLLAGRATQMLFIPAEQMVYYAIDYNDYGIGKSLIDSTKMLSTIRTALQFASLNGNMLNCTRNQEFTIQLDPNDREAEKTVEDAKYRIVQGFNNMIPFTGTPTDMWATMANAGISFNVEGNEYYPTTKVSVTDNSPDYKVPDRDVMEDAARNQYRGFGVDPDLIVSPQAIEYASQITSKNLLQTRQICLTQDKLNPFWTKTVTTYTRSSGPLLNGLADIVREYMKTSENKDGTVGYWLRLFLNNLTVRLPKPETGQLTSQLEMFDAYSESVDKILEATTVDDVLPQEMDVDLNRYRAILKTHLMTQWLRDNDVCPELISIFDDVEGYRELVYATVESAARNVTLSAMLYKSADKRIRDILDKMEVEMSDENSDSSSSDSDWGGSDSSDDSSYGDDFGDDTGDGSDFGSDDDNSFDGGDDMGSDGDLGGDQGDEADADMGSEAGDSAEDTTDTDSNSEDDDSLNF